MTRIPSPDALLPASAMEGRANQAPHPFIPPRDLEAIYGDLRPTRHVTIQPELPLWEASLMAIVCAFIGAMLAIGGVL